jgi:hypothetical protein
VQRALNSIIPEGIQKIARGRGASAPTTPSSTYPWNSTLKGVPEIPHHTSSSDKIEFNPLSLTLCSPAPIESGFAAIHSGFQVNSSTTSAHSRVGRLPFTRKRMYIRKVTTNTIETDLFPDIHTPGEKILFKSRTYVFAIRSILVGCLT